MTGPSAPTGNRPSIARGIAVIAVLAIAPAAVIVAVLTSRAGHGQASAPATEAIGKGAAVPYPLLVALPVILAACYAAGAAIRRIGQPAVIGEIIAGVLLGPSLLGAVWPAASAWLFPPGVVAAISLLAQLGLIFFMYLIGTEMNLSVMRERGIVAVTVSQASIALPMLAGTALAFALYPSFGGRVSFIAFTLFIAVSMSVTAFPVLARILSDRGLTATPLGTLALACAAIGDVAAWCLLATVITIAHGGSAVHLIVTIALVAAFAVVMVLVVRPLLSWLAARVTDQAMLSMILAGVMLSALVTSQMGIHPIFGAFLFGVIAPRSAPAARRAATSLESVTVSLLLPLFFVYTGLQTRFGLLGPSLRLWTWCALIVTVAMLSKWGAATAAARLTRVGWRESLSLGALMNCRGLTELIVLNVGLQLKVISPVLFTMLVIMTLITTIATAPLLTAIRPAAAAGEPAFTRYPSATPLS
jgi:Kef-type K+ transport system membrane component KefB